MSCGCQHSMRGIFPHPVSRRRGMGDMITNAQAAINGLIEAPSVIGNELYDAATGLPNPTTMQEINAATNQAVTQASGGNPAAITMAQATPADISRDLNAVYQQAASASTGSPLTNFWDELTGSYTGSSIWAPQGQSNGSFLDWLFNWPNANNPGGSGPNWFHIAIFVAAGAGAIWAAKEFL